MDRKPEFENNPLNPPEDFESEFEEVRKKIDILERYEIYLSETFPAKGLLEETIAKQPELETILEKLVTRLVGAIDYDMTKKEILDCAITILRSEIDCED